MEIEEKIFEMIRSGMGKTQLSERTLRSQAARAAKKVESLDDVTDDFINDIVEGLKELEGQYSHDVKEQVEKQLLLKKPKKEGPFEGNRDDDEMQRTLSEMGKKLREFEDFRKNLEENAREEAERKKNDLFVSQVLEAMENAGCSDADMRELVVLKHGVDPDKSVDDNVTLLKPEYDGRMSKRHRPSVLPATDVLKSAAVVDVPDNDRADQARQDIDAIRKSGPRY